MPFILPDGFALSLRHYHRFKNHRKALVTSVDKKIPNGFMEEQGTITASA